jgi:nitrous oxidase accessory protein NosD
MVLADADDSRVQYNHLDGNDHGIAGFGGGSLNTVRYNAVSHSRGSAIDVGGDGASAISVRYNRLKDNGDGILVGDAPDTVVSDNVVTGTGNFGCPDTGRFGIILDGTDHTTVDRNIVTGGRDPAIFVAQLDAPTAAENNVISRNRATSKVWDGIFIGTGRTGTVVIRNIANRNADDGIDVREARTTVTRNIADHNHDLGIEAIPGVIDGGGNHAVGNGNPAQCTGITCVVAH